MNTLDNNSLGSFVVRLSAANARKLYSAVSALLSYNRINGRSNADPDNYNENLTNAIYDVLQSCGYDYLNKSNSSVELTWDLHLDSKEELSVCVTIQLHTTEALHESQIRGCFGLSDTPFHPAIPKQLSDLEKMK